MFKKYFYLMIVIPAALALAACSSLKLPGTSSNSTQGQQNPGANFANQPVADKLAIGTLKLEGTDKAVTAEQAKNLLPLWKALKSLSASSTASTQEVSALYTQIQEGMTKDQIQAITDLKLAPTDTQAMAQKYGIQMPQGGGPNPSRTRTSGSQSQGTGNAAGGPGGDPGFGPGGPGGGIPGGGLPPDVAGNSGAGTQSGRSTPQPGQAARRPVGGMNQMFFDAVIQLLEQRAAS